LRSESHYQSTFFIREDTELAVEFDATSDDRTVFRLCLGGSQVLVFLGHEAERFLSALREALPPVRAGDIGSAVQDAWRVAEEMSDTPDAAHEIVLEEIDKLWTHARLGVASDG